MSKTAINRIKNDDAPEALPFSPLVWTSKGFKVLTEDIYNLKKIQTALYKVHADLNENLREVKLLRTEVEKTESAVTALVDRQQLLITIAGELQDRVFPVLQTLSNLSARISLTNSELQKRLVTAEEIAAVVHTIRSGQLLQAVGKDIDVVLNDSSYLLTSKNSTGLLESGDGIVKVDYFPDSNHYEISGGVTDQADLVETQMGLRVDVSADKKYATISVTRDLIDGFDGMLVDYSPLTSVFTLRPSSTLLKAAPNSGLSVLQNASGSFQIDLSALVQVAANRRFIAGSGVIITGRTIAVDTTVIPRFAAGSPGVAVNRTSLNPDVYQIDFDEGQESIPAGLFKRLEVEVKSPLKIEYNVEPNKHRISIDRTAGNLDPALSGDIQLRIADLESNALAIMARRVVKHTDLSPTFRQAFMNPIMRMFYLLVGDYKKSGLVANASTAKLKLLERFGVRPSVIEINENVMPYVAVTGHGADYVIGSEVEVDLFSALERKMQKELKDDSFKILPAERNVRYKLVEVDTGSATSIKWREQGTQPPLIMNYNSAFSIEFLESLSKNSYIAGVVQATVCPELAALSSYYSTKFQQLKLAVTGGDVDFIAGKARYGQANATELIFPTNLQEVDRIKLRGVTESVDANGTTTYEMTVYDGYTAATYVAKFSKLAASKITDDADYITEDSGKTNPGQVRAFCRLYANWRLSDLDINRLIFFFARSNKCLAKFSGQLIEVGVVKQVLYTKDMTASDLPDYGASSSQGKVDYDKGTIKINVAQTADGFALANFGIADVIANLRIRAQFRIEGFGDYSSDTSLLAASCWSMGTTPTKPASCQAIGVVGKPLPFNNPEADFGAGL